MMLLTIICTIIIGLIMGIFISIISVIMGIIYTYYTVKIHSYWTIKNVNLKKFLKILIIIKFWIFFYTEIDMNDFSKIN